MAVVDLAQVDVRPRDLVIDGQLRPRPNLTSLVFNHLVQIQFILVWNFERVIVRFLTRHQRIPVGHAREI